MTSLFLTYCKSGFVCFVGSLLVFVATPSLLTAQTQMENVDLLVEYVASQMLLAPDHDGRVDEATGPHEATGLRRKFLVRLARSVDARVQEHVAENPEVSSRCDAYIRLLDAMQMTSGDPGSLDPFDDSTWISQAIRCLAENIDRDGVFEKYKELPWPGMEARHAGEIVNISQKKEIRAWACNKRLARATGNLVSACKADSEITDEEFDSQFDEVSQLLEIAVDELADAPADKPGPTIKDSGLFHAKIADYLERETGFDESRKNKVIALCRRVAQK